MADKRSNDFKDLVSLAGDHFDAGREEYFSPPGCCDPILGSDSGEVLALSDDMPVDSKNDRLWPPDAQDKEDITQKSLINSASNEEAEARDRFSPGTVINQRYEIVRLLGRGGMGEVYLAGDLRISRNVALKVLHPDLVAKKENFQRFAREAQTASGLNHPHIMTVYEVESSEDGALFIVAEFIEGQPLSTLIRNGIRIEKALDIASQVASALGAAHRAGIIHRDIKPENIMIRYDGYVKVLDFGLAKLTQARPPSTDSGSEDPTIPILRTKPGMVMGTAAYMSPEQARGLSVDARTDIWSLGAVLYEMITGRRPFWGETTADTMVSVLTKEPRPISDITGQSFPELEAIVSRALSKNSEDRYQSMDELRADLEALRKKIEIGAVLEASFPRLLDTDSGIEISSQRHGHSTNPDATRGQRDTKGGRGLYAFPDILTVVTGSNSRAVSYATRSIRVALLIGIGVFLAVAAIYLVSFNRNSQLIDSVAVLPFENLTGDTSLNYLSDGISEVLIDRLSELPQLKVISRSSSFKFRSPEADLQAVASQLGVKAIVTGSISQVGDELNIRYEIIDAAENRHLFGGQFRRKLGNITAIQHDIAENAANNLRLKLTDSQSRRLSGGNTEDSEAYRYYLNGLVEINGPQDVRGKALEYFQRAVELDPGFAAAYAEIGWIYMSRANGSGNPESLVPQAREAINRALSLDPELAKAHVVRAMIYEYDFDWTNAENEYRRAVELSPNLDFARNNYAFFLSVTGRHDEALEQLEQQRLRDPINERLGLLQKGIVLVQARRFDEALQVYQAAQAVEPSREIPHFSLGYAYAGKGMYSEAAKHFEISAERLGGLQKTSQPLIYLAAAYANIPGQRQKAKEILTQIESREQYASPALLAIVYTALGEEDKAIDLLEAAYNRRDLLLRYIGTGFEYDRLRKNPRFVDLIRRVGIGPS